MKKIVVLRDAKRFEKRILDVASDWELVFTTDKESAKNNLQGAEIVAGWSSEVEKYVRSDANTVKWVQHFSAGVDDLPLDLLKKKGILITNASGVHPKQISESVFAMMLGLARGIPHVLSLQREAKWSYVDFKSENLLEIHGKTIGILGTGVIGEEIARIARAFTMRTLGFRRTEKSAPYIDEMYTHDRLYEMLGKCDYIVNILPLTDKTKNLIDEKAFNSMKKGARYFPFGRGETTNTDALIKALKSGHLGAAGIDVIDPEPLPSTSELWGFENVILAPHMSGHTSVYDDRVMDIFIDNIKSYVNTGKPSVSVVNIELQY